jgi:small subunit ribosomal protein S20
MANIKSQKKRILTNEKARLRNKSVKSSLTGDKTAATEAARAANRELDIAVRKGVIHSNQAANRKSAISKKADSL